MKADEEQFLRDVANKGERSVRQLIANDRLPYKRCWYLLQKWADKGWYDYGVSLDLGWLTPEGLRIIS